MGGGSGNDKVDIMLITCSSTDALARREWVAKRHLKISPRRNGVHAFLGRSVQHELSQAFTRDNNLRGWDDHGEVWISTRPGRFKRAACYTSQPYDLSQEDLRQLHELARLHGLTVDIRPDSESWYCPGHSKLIALWAPTAT